MEEAFGRVPRKVVEWAVRKKAIPGAFVGAVMRLCRGEKTKVKVEEFEVNVGVHQGSVLSPLLFAM